MCILFCICFSERSEKDNPENQATFLLNHKIIKNLLRMSWPKFASRSQFFSAVDNNYDFLDQTCRTQKNSLNDRLQKSLIFFCQFCAVFWFGIFKLKPQWVEIFSKGIFKRYIFNKKIKIAVGISGTRISQLRTKTQNYQLCWTASAISTNKLKSPATSTE